MSIDVPDRSIRAEIKARLEGDPHALAQTTLPIPWLRLSCALQTAADLAHVLLIVWHLVRS